MLVNDKQNKYASILCEMLAGNKWPGEKEKRVGIRSGDGGAAGSSTAIFSWDLLEGSI